MKVRRKKTVFTPIIITLETNEEAQLLVDFLSENLSFEGSMTESDDFADGLLASLSALD